MKHFIALLFLFLGVLSGAFATDIRSGDEVIISTPVSEDLYLGATTVRIMAVVDGDLFAAAQYCFLEDTIREDVTVIGQNVNVEAPILDDARLMGSQIHIGADIFGDLLIGGGNVLIDREVTIHGNLYLAGGSVKVYGRILGTVEIAGGEVFFDGMAEDQINLKAGTLAFSGTARGDAQLTAERLSLTDQAAFFQDVRYWSSEGPVDFGTSLKAGQIARFDEALRGERYDGNWQRMLGVGATFFLIGRLLSAALVTLILVWAFQRFFRRTSNRLIGNYATSLGYGLLYLLGMPLLILIALITVIGIPVGLFSLATYGVSLAFAHILTALLVTYWWQAYNLQYWNNTQTVLVAIGVFAVLKLISWIPFIGWLISLAAVATTFGALLAELLRSRRKEEVEEFPKPETLSV